MRTLFESMSFLNTVFAASSRLTRGRCRVAATASTALWALGAMAHAQATPPVFELVLISVEVDGWTILPIASDGATSHLIATRNDHMTLATDIDVVLYERTANGWLGSAYDPSMTLEDAAIDLAAEFGLSSPLEGSWLIDLDPANVTGHTLPRTSFGSGFFTTDPLHAVAVQMADPDPLAEAAEQSGFPAATSTVNTGQISPGGGASSPTDPEPIGNCLRGAEARERLKDAIAAGTNAYLSGNASAVSEAEAIAFNTWQQFAACCVP